MSGTLPFEEVLAPLASAAVSRLQRRTGRSWRRLSAESHAALQRGLLERLSLVASPALYEEFARRPRRSYRAFVADMAGRGLDEFLVERAGLERLLDAIVRNWASAVAELMERLRADGAALRRAFPGASGQVIALEPGLSDPHAGGRTVHALRFAGGARVIYKPRALDGEHAFHALVTWLNRRGLSPRVRAARVLRRGGYGWMQSIATRDCASAAGVELYYRRAGELLAIGYLLGARDWHAGNVIASGSDPVIVDLEALVQPDLTGSASDDADVLLATGLLPALASFAGHDTGIRMIEWRSPNTGAMRPKSTVVLTMEKQNLPTLRGVAVSAEQHGAALITGFANAWRFIVRHRDALAAKTGPLEPFRRLRVRCILRPTAEYAQIFLDSLVNEAALERLQRAALHAPVIGEERLALSSGDVPVFYTASHERGIRGASGRVIVADAFEPGASAMMARLREMDEARLSALGATIRTQLALATLRRLLPPRARSSRGGAG